MYNDFAPHSTKNIKVTLGGNNEYCCPIVHDSWVNFKKEKKKFPFHCMRIDDNLQFIMLINNIKTLWNRTECFIILKQLWYESFWNKTSFWFLLQHIKAANEVHKTNPSETYKCCIYGWEYNNFKSLKCLFVGRRKIK